MINIHLCQLFFLRKVWTCFQGKPEHFPQKHVQREDVEFGSRLAFYCVQELMWNGQFASLLRPLSKAVCGKLQHWSAAGLFQLVSCANVSGCGRVFLVSSCSMRCRSHTHWLEFSVGQLGSESSGNTRLVLWEVCVSVCFLSPLVSTQALTLCY